MDTVEGVLIMTLSGRRLTIQNFAVAPTARDPDDVTQRLARAAAWESLRHDVRIESKFAPEVERYQSTLLPLIKRAYTEYSAQPR